MTRDQLQKVIAAQARWLSGIDENRRRIAMAEVLKACDDGDCPLRIVRHAVA